MAEQAMENCQLDATVNEYLESRTFEFVDQLPISKVIPSYRPGEKQWLGDVALLAVRYRSSVDREGKDRSIELVHMPEAPSRLAQQLRVLLASLEAVGVLAPYRYELVRKVALDSIPPTRTKVLTILADSHQPLTIPHIERLAQLPGVVSPNQRN